MSTFSIAKYVNIIIITLGIKTRAMIADVPMKRQKANMAVKILRYSTKE